MLPEARAICPDDKLRRSIQSIARREAAALLVEMIFCAGPVAGVQAGSLREVEPSRQAPARAASRKGGEWAKRVVGRRVEPGGVNSLLRGASSTPA
jgi:hypothetical protein